MYPVGIGKLSRLTVRGVKWSDIDRGGDLEELTRARYRDEVVTHTRPVGNAYVPECLGA